MAAMCLVCRADVEEKKARETNEYKGKTYCFCSKVCKKRLDEATQRNQTES